MKLTRTNTISSALGKHLKSIYALEVRGAFLMSDEWKIILLHPDGSIQLVWQTDDEAVAYKWRGLFDDRLSGAMYDEIGQFSNGFKPLKEAEYKRIERSGLYASPRVITPFLCRGHHDVLLAFEGKRIGLLRCTDEDVSEYASVKTKGSTRITESLHPCENLIVYGTNRGEIFGQMFHADGFGKGFKIDLMPNTCHQISFSPDGRRMFVAGLGYLRFYDYDGTSFTLSASVSTAVRSFVLAGDYMVLNKGMHGIDVMRVTGHPERISSMNYPFMIDQMHYLPAQSTFLLISGSSDEWALLRWDD